MSVVNGTLCQPLDPPPRPPPGASPTPHPRTPIYHGSCLSLQDHTGRCAFSPGTPFIMLPYGDCPLVKQPPYTPPPPPPPPSSTLTMDLCVHTGESAQVIDFWKVKGGPSYRRRIDCGPPGGDQIIGWFTPGGGRYSCVGERTGWPPNCRAIGRSISYISLDLFTGASPASSRELPADSPPECPPSPAGLTPPDPPAPLTPISAAILPINNNFLHALYSLSDGMLLGCHPSAASQWLPVAARRTPPSNQAAHYYIMAPFMTNSTRLLQAKTNPTYNFRIQLQNAQVGIAMDPRTACRWRERAVLSLAVTLSECSVLVTRAVIGGPGHQRVLNKRHCDWLIHQPDE